MLWFKKRKVVIINPSRGKAAVGVFTQLGPAYVQRFQIGLSPELIRETEAWHPDSRGKVIVFLLDEEGAQIKLGPVQLSAKPTTKSGGESK